MTTTCTVTGRTHYTKREQADRLAEIDTQAAQLATILRTFAAISESDTMGGDSGNAIGDAWNATHDAVTALETERRQVEDNPHPIPAGLAGSYELAAANID